MVPKTILVCLTTREHAATLMKVAVPRARRTGAHLVGLHTLEALEVYPGIAVHVPDSAFKAFNDSQKEAADAIEDTFNSTRRITKRDEFLQELWIAMLNIIQVDHHVIAHLQR